MEVTLRIGTELFDGQSTCLNTVAALYSLQLFHMCR